MASQAEIVTAYRRLKTAQRERTTAAVAQVWLSMDSWSDAAAGQMLNQVVPIVLGGQQATATMTGAYLQQLLGRQVQLDTKQLVGAAVRNGIDPFEVYQRAVTTARVTYSRSDLVDLAINAGLRQLVNSVATDLQLSANHASREAIRQSGVGTYRRATGPGACDLCVAASDNVYTVEDLLPIHTNCSCVVVPGERLPSGLRRASNQQAPRDGRGLVVNDNGEIGPILDYADRAPRARGSGRRTLTAKTITPADSIRMKQVQLATYEDILANGGGTQWMVDKTAELRAEMATIAANAAN